MNNQKTIDNLRNVYKLFIDVGEIFIDKAEELSEIHEGTMFEEPTNEDLLKDKTINETIKYFFEELENCKNLLTKYTKENE